jgi:hypothetical protein
MATNKNRSVYQLKVTLREIDPPIWRRIEVWDDTTLTQLHRILQIVMGWEDYHLHEFHIGGRAYGVPDPDGSSPDRTVSDERHQRLGQLVSRVGTAFDYVYDFGDDWRHELLLEAIVPPEPDRQYPRCLAGERNGPPEDAGGPFGYARYLQALADHRHKEHEATLERRGPFDSEWVFARRA